VRLAVYRAFVATGKAPSAADVATAVGAPAADVLAAFERLDAGRGIVLEPGTHDVWLANPFSATPTGFEVQTASRRYYAACGWDTLGIIPLLHEGGTVFYTCPDCDQPTELEVPLEGPAPGETVIYFGVPAARWWEDLGST